MWVNEILLDSTNEALVLDCCVMPEDSIGHEASLQLVAGVGGMLTKLIKVPNLWWTLLCRDIIVIVSALACPTYVLPLFV